MVKYHTHKELWDMAVKAVTKHVKRGHHHKLKQIPLIDINFSSVAKKATRVATQKISKPKSKTCKIGKPSKPTMTKPKSPVGSKKATSLSKKTSSKLSKPTMSKPKAIGKKSKGLNFMKRKTMRL